MSYAAAKKQLLEPARTRIHTATEVTGETITTELPCEPCPVCAGLYFARRIDVPGERVVDGWFLKGVAWWCWSCLKPGWDGDKPMPPNLETITISEVRKAA